MRARLYARVSTEEQTEGYSIDAQRRAFQVLCQGRGWTADYEYIEAGRSAHTDDMKKRPVFKQAIDDALAGKYDVLVVHKIDRFARKLRVTLEYFEKLGKAGIGFVSIENQIDYSTPTGKFMLAMQGGLAELYSDNLSQETKKGWAERKAQGLYCGLLPFGAKKGEDGTPVPNPETYPGLKMAFELAGQGKSYREVAQALNSSGYRTAGNMGNRPFSKDTVVGMLKNHFYIGELPDGNGGWLIAKHKPFISKELFDAVQDVRAQRQCRRHTINTKARTYSLSTLMWCKKCGSKMRMQQSPKGEVRTYCAGRAKGLGCDCRGTFLSIYEGQIRWYLENFIIPQDYQDKIVEAHRKLQSAYDDTEKHKAALESRLERAKELYQWGHKSRDEYLADYEDIQKQLRLLSPIEVRDDHLSKLAQFLANVAEAWDEANQEQRNKIAKILFEQILVENNKVVAVKPRPELEPFFKLNLECHSRDIASDPDGIRTVYFPKMIRVPFTLSTPLMIYSGTVRSTSLCGQD